MKITREPSLYLTIPNEVIQKALAIYVYVMSKEENIFSEEEIADHFCLTVKKVEECFKYLDELGLLKFNPESSL